MKPPEKIYAKVNGASMEMFSGRRSQIGGWHEHARPDHHCYIREDAALSCVPWVRSIELPEPGRKVVMIYNDGSGAVLLWRRDDAFLDADGGELNVEWWEANVGAWCYLPDDVDFWCEQRSEDPVTLRGQGKREEAP